MSENATLDGSCVLYLSDFVNSWHESNSIGIPLWSVISACYFCSSAFALYKLRSIVTRVNPENHNFNLKLYARLLASGLLFCAVSEIFLAIPDRSFTPPPESNPNDITTRFLGNKHISTWQLLYAIGNVQLVASKIFVLVRLLEFSSKYSPSARLHAPRLRIAMWSIYALFSVTFIGAAALLFFGTMLSSISANLYVAANTVISVARLLMFLALAIIFAYGGILSLTVAQRSLAPLNQTLFAVDSRKSNAKALQSRDLMSELVFKLRVSTAWNVCWFLVVFLFYLLLSLGITGMRGSWDNVCDNYQPALTRMIPFLIGPIPTFGMLLGSDVMAAMITLWAMLPSDQRRDSLKTLSDVRSMDVRSMS
jgi:hypothetical protein